MNEKWSGEIHGYRGDYPFTVTPKRGHIQTTITIKNEDGAILVFKHIVLTYIADIQVVRFVIQVHAIIFAGVFKTEIMHKV